MKVSRYEPRAENFATFIPIDLFVNSLRGKELRLKILSR